MSYHAVHLYLCGYRGSGKTSVGHWLGQRLALPVLDLDDEIERSAQQTIREIFAAEGEPGFREREAACLSAVSALPPHIISLGGGAILRPDNRDLIRRSGHCVWLQVDAPTALARMQQDHSTNERRPALTTLPPLQEIESLLQAREPWYRATAHQSINVVGKSVDVVGTEILQALPSAWLMHATAGP